MIISAFYWWVVHKNIFRNVIVWSPHYCLQFYLCFTYLEIVIAVIVSILKFFLPGCES